MQTARNQVRKHERELPVSPMQVPISGARLTNRVVTGTIPA
jgi:hypothetical protein